MEEPAVSLREQRKKETREALLDAGTKLFAEQGLDAPSLDDICRRVGFTRGAFYVHFPDREAFIVEVVARATTRFAESILVAKGEGTSVPDIILAFAACVSAGVRPVFADIPLHQFLEACARSFTLHLRYVAILVGVRSRLTEAVRADQESGVLRGGVDPELVAGLLLALALGVGTLAALGTPFNARAHGDALLALIGQSPREVVAHVDPPGKSRRRRPARS